MHELKRKILIGSIILASVVVIFATFFFLFKNNISRQLENIELLKSKKTLFSESTSGVVVLKKEWEVAKRYEETLNKYIFSKEDLITVPQKVKQSAQKNNVNAVFSFGSEGDKQSGAQQFIQFTASIEGQENNVLAFLRDFDTQFHTVNTNTIDIVRTVSGIRASLSGKIQYY